MFVLPAHRPEHIFLAYTHLRLIGGLVEASTSRDREFGFERYLDRHGRAPLVKASGYYSYEDARDAARTLLSLKEPPGAIFCADDQMAIATIEVGRYEFGLEIGRQLSVVGFDDVKMASWPSFELTTFSYPVATMVDEALQLLMSSMKASRSRAIHKTIGCQLVVRRSARLPEKSFVG